VSSKYKKAAAKNALAESKWRHLNSLEHGIQKSQIVAQQKGWNYSDFVAHILEVIVVLRLREELERDSRQKGR
jgi:hypothetical protein